MVRAAGFESAGFLITVTQIEIRTAIEKLRNRKLCVRLQQTADKLGRSGRPEQLRSGSIKKFK
jgi:hypothetical protein